MNISDNSISWLIIKTEKELSRLNFKADIYENELEELYEEGYDPYEAAEKYYDDWNHE